MDKWDRQEKLLELREQNQLKNLELFKKWDAECVNSIDDNTDIPKLLVWEIGSHGKCCKIVIEKSGEPIHYFKTRTPYEIKSWISCNLKEYGSLFCQSKENLKHDK